MGSYKTKKIIHVIIHNINVCIINFTKTSKRLFELEKCLNDIEENHMWNVFNFMNDVHKYGNNYNEMDIYWENKDLSMDFWKWFFKESQKQKIEFEIRSIKNNLNLLKKSSYYAHIKSIRTDDFKSNINSEIHKQLQDYVDEMIKYCNRILNRLAFLERTCENNNFGVEVNDAYERKLVHSPNYSDTVISYGGLKNSFEELREQLTIKQTYL